MSAAGAVAASGAPAVAPEGPRLTRNIQLFVVSRSGDSVRRITHDRLHHDGPVWSSDGELIADYVQIKGRTKVEVLTKRGKLVRRFDAGDQAVEAPPSWSPDGRRLAFPSSYYNRDRDATDARLVVVSVDGGDRRRVADLAVGRPSWAPDGRSLIYLRGDIIRSYANGGPDDGPDEPVDGNEYDVWTADADGGGTRPLVRETSSAGTQYSPNGRRLLFFRAPDETGYEQLWTARANGSEQRRISGGNAVPDAGWAPKGRGIWLNVSRRKGPETYLFTPDGKRKSLPVVIGWPMDWSNDAKLIAWGDGERVSTIRRNGSQQRTHFRFRTPFRPKQGDGYCDYLQWRPDGREFLVGCHEDVSD